MSIYLRKGTTTIVIQESNVTPPAPSLAPGFYSVNHSLSLGFHLEDSPEMTLPSKVYGNPGKMADRFIQTFESRPRTTGVLLSGLKGAGKSLLLKDTCIRAVAAGYPVIIVNSAFENDDFCNFIQSLDNCVIVIDEFEKIFPKPEDQTGLLTLMDGIKAGKKMYILTVNDEDNLNENLINRPGRIFYHLSFDGLSDEFIREYVYDALDEEYRHYAEEIIGLTVSYTFSFDMLSAIVEEINRYGETPQQALSLINVVDDTPRGLNVYLYRKGSDIELDYENDGVEYWPSIVYSSRRDNYINIRLASGVHEKVRIPNGIDTFDAKIADENFVVRLVASSKAEKKFR